MMKLKLFSCLFAGLFLFACSEEEPYDGKEFETGLELFNTDAYAEAIPHFKSHTSQEATDTMGWYFLGMSYHSVDSFEQAIEAYSKTLEAFPDYASAMRNRAICYMALSDPESTLQNIDAIIALNKDSIYSTDYYYKSRCMIAKGDMEAAYDAIFEAMKLDEQNMYNDLFFSFINGNFSEEYLQKRYYEERGMTANYTFNADSVRHGPWGSFYDNGEKYEAGFYKDGKRDGKQTEWMKGGAKLSETIYENGRLNGTRLTWHENKQLNSRVNYVNDQRQGWALSWYASGGPLGAFYFVDNQRDSIAGRWYEDGKLAEQIRYQQGVQQGKAIIWNLQKEAYMEVTFENDNPIDETMLEALPDNILKFPGK